MIFKDVSSFPDALAQTNKRYTVTGLYPNQMDGT